MNSRRLARVLIAAALMGAVVRISAAHAQPAPTFGGKTIRLYIGTSPGGGYDTYGRLVARHIGRRLPGNPAVVAQNMPGASSLVLANFLFNQAPRDGSALGIINQSMPTEQYLLEQNVNYEASKFNWIGRVSSTVELLIVWHTVPVARINDVRSRETIMGGTGPTSSTEFIPRVLNNLAGMKFNVISGFQGTSDVALAMERGEVEGSGTPLESLSSYRANWVRDKKINTRCRRPPRATLKSRMFPPWWKWAAPMRRGRSCGSSQARPRSAARSWRRLVLRPRR
jgi:tripartite-type tricarboxylate transporter receptor subunit TctC